MVHVRTVRRCELEPRQHVTSHKGSRYRASTTRLLSSFARSLLCHAGGLRPRQASPMIVNRLEAHRSDFSRRLLKAVLCERSQQKYNLRPDDSSCSTLSILPSSSGRCRSRRSEARRRAAQSTSSTESRRRIGHLSWRLTVGMYCPSGLEGKDVCSDDR